MKFSTNERARATALRPFVRAISIWRGVVFHHAPGLHSSTLVVVCQQRSLVMADDDEAALQRPFVSLDVLR
ncbi:unnamed protein product [Soboliphyme baturini]|uniref:DUF1150 family protein n=1 Tax=Soboliphyme baturini TaxID=241478 RepID=A0A183J6E8_9BILA|nr:unnamed protein product [Soboliphyme baturini]